MSQQQEKDTQLDEYDRWKQSRPDFQGWDEVTRRAMADAVTRRKGTGLNPWWIVLLVWLFANLGVTLALYRLVVDTLVFSSLISQRFTATAVAISGIWILNLVLLFGFIKIEGSRLGRRVLERLE